MAHPSPASRSPEVGNETFTLEMLKQDPSSPDAYRCESRDSRHIQEGTYLVTGNIRITEKSTAFISAIREKCDNNGTMSGNVNHFGESKIGVKWKDANGKNEREIYTLPIAPRPNIGFGMQF